MITEKQYFGEWLYKPDVTNLIRENCVKFLKAVNALELEAIKDGVVFPINPCTGSQISGAQFGGFRPLSCPIGAAGSSHKQGKGLDRYDPHNEIDEWCFANAGKDGLLQRHGIYIEHPSKTDKWSHWTNRRPESGNRVFMP